MYEREPAERYVRAVVKEMAEWREVERPADVETIYFGGGTPSLLSPKQISQILEAIRAKFCVVTDPEITIEINPGDGGTSAASKQETMRAFRKLGINRASFGAQTFDDDQLRQLGRTHSSQDIRTTFDDLRKAEFENINFDLIAGLPNQSIADWNQNLNSALELRPNHLSLYLLDVHEGTPLADQITRGARPKPDDDVAAEMYRLMIDKVCAAGYEHYEISNFCLPGFESWHNTKYWNGAPYYGFGCSAHSYDGARRRWSNERDSAKYVSFIEKRQSPIVERNELNEDQAQSERAFLGLRLMRGLDLKDYQERFGKDLLSEHRADLGRFREAGLIEIDDRLLRLTTRGALLSNEVLSAFV
jgi:oxygen-independent coproporphyrinogen III oxidase